MSYNQESQNKEIVHDLIPETEEPSEMTNFEKVGEFHEMFGHPKLDEPRWDVFDKDPKLLEARVAFMQEELDECKEAIQNKDLPEVADALCDLLYFAYGTGHALGLNLDKMFKEVHNCNMTKLCQNEEEAKETIQWYKQNNNTYEDPQYRQKGKYYVVYDNKTSKILKCHKWREPKLENLMEK